MKYGLGVFNFWGVERVRVVIRVKVSKTSSVLGLELEF
jgi:hypothetical protein